MVLCTDSQNREEKLLLYINYCLLRIPQRVCTCHPHVVDDTFARLRGRILTEILITAERGLALVA